MIERSYDPDILAKAMNSCKQIENHINPKDWLNDKNIMLVSGNDVGLATYEYDGFYTVHWFFGDSRGRAAINLAREMLDYGFKAGIKVYRGVTRTDIRPARYLARKVGFKSYGMLHYVGDEIPHELFIMTKDEFYKGSK